MKNSFIKSQKSFMHDSFSLWFSKCFLDYNFQNIFLVSIMILFLGLVPNTSFELSFDDNKKPEKIQKENTVGGTGEGTRWKGNIKEGWRESKTGTVLQKGRLGAEVKFAYKIKKK